MACLLPRPGLRLGAGRSGCEPTVPTCVVISIRRAARHCSRRHLLAAAGRGVDDWAPSPRDLASWDAGRTDEELDSDDELDLFPEEAQGDPEFVIENVLALVLILLAALAAANILLKLVIIAYALVSAAVRYTAIGVFLAYLLTVVTPGRWWF